MSGYTGTMPELYYSFSGAGTALATFTTEASLMGGYPIPQIPATFFSKLGEQSSAMKIRAYGNISTTATPTFTLSARLLTSATSWTAGGLLLGTSTTVTAASGITNAWWQMDADSILQSIAAGAATSSIGTFGLVSGPAFGTANGSIPGTNVSANNATLDNTGATQYYLWLSAACGTSSASNTIRLQGLKIYLEN
jgi:hypothetical protein